MWRESWSVLLLSSWNILPASQRRLRDPKSDETEKRIQQRIEVLLKVTQKRVRRASRCYRWNDRRLLDGMSRPAGPHLAAPQNFLNYNSIN